MKILHHTARFQHVKLSILTAINTNAHCIHALVCYFNGHTYPLQPNGKGVVSNLDSPQH